MHVLWEKHAVDDPVAHRAKYRKRWMIAGVIAGLLSLSVLSFGVWGLVYPAIVALVAALVIEMPYRVRLRTPPVRVWTDGQVLGVEGAGEIIGQSLDPVPLSSVQALTVYPIAGGYRSGPTINGVSTSRQVHYTAVDLWIGDGSRRLWILDRAIGITVEHEAALARALADYLPDRWRVPPADDDRGADIGEIDRGRLAEWYDPR